VILEEYVYDAVGGRIPSLDGVHFIWIPRSSAAGIFIDGRFFVKHLPLIKIKGIIL